MSARVRVVIRIGRGTPLSRTLWFSAIAHGLFVIAAVTLPGLTADRSLPLPTLDVTLVGPLVEAPARAQAPAPAPAPPQPEPEAKPAEPEGPSVTPADVPEPVPRREPDKPREKKPEKKPEPKPRAAPQQPPAPGPEVGGPGPGGPPAAASGPIGVPQGGALAGMGSEFDWYRDAVIRALYASWSRPFAADIAEAQEVGVAFEIRQDGTVGAVRIVEPSGNPSLDRSALRAVHEAALPPLPRNYGRAAQPAHFVFRLEPESR